MRMRKARICLVEPRHGHPEVLLPQIDLLQDDYDIYVLAPQSLLEVDLLSNTKESYQGIPLRWNQWQPRLRRLFRMPGMYRDIRRSIDSIRPDFVLFNSVPWIGDLLLIATLFKGVRKGQIIHNFQKFLRPGMRWLYKQFDLNLVISEEVHSYITENHPEYRSLDYFLPIYFDVFQPPPSAVGDAQPEARDLFQLGVFGSVDGQRRNFEGLFKSLAVWRREHPIPCFVLHIVGNLPAKYRDLVARYDLGQMVRYYESFVPFEEMFRVLRKVDVVLFLIDTAVHNCEFYNHYKISGSSTLIKGFQKACAASRDFRLDAILADKCFHYDGASIEQIFEAIAKGSINKAVVREMELRYSGNKLLLREEQKARLVQAIRRACT